MYMRVTPGRIDPARIDEVVSQVLPDLVAAVKRQPGNQSYVTGLDRASGRTITVGLWDTEQQARFSRDDVLGAILTRLQAAGVQVDPSEFFEVTSS